MNYIKADQTLGSKMVKKVANNTYLVRNSGVPGDMIHLKLHSTYVVTFYNNVDQSMRLYNGGWRTATTKNRIHDAIKEHGWYLTQRKGEWILGRFDNDAVHIPFEEGIAIRSDGFVNLDEVR